jgi:hypothetical protein
VQQVEAGLELIQRRPRLIGCRPHRLEDELGLRRRLRRCRGESLQDRATGVRIYCTIGEIDRNRDPQPRDPTQE